MRLLPIPQSITKPRSAKGQRPWGCKPRSKIFCCEGDRGQALAELAIFGSLLILLLGSLVNYGLRYNYQQKVMQRAFREALADASQGNSKSNPRWGQASYTLIKDKHIPDPANPFAIGSITPIVASASIIRNPRLEETADDVDSLPQIAVDIKGSLCPESRLKKRDSPPCYYLTAGFREENNVAFSKSVIDKYIEIYGQTVQGCRQVEGGKCVGKEKWANIYDDEGDLSGEIDTSTECEEEESIDPSGNAYCPENKQKTVLRKIRFIDNSAGEIVDYESAIRQCRQIINSKFFKKECDRGRPPASEDDETTSCAELSRVKIRVPWYCETEECGRKTCDSSDRKNRKYTFTKLDEIFGFAASSAQKSMGLQENYTQNTLMDNQLQRHEDASSVTSTDTRDWTSRINRTMVRLNYGGEEVTDVIKDEVSSEVCDEGNGCDTNQKTTAIWSTDK